jgi:hypothetical protein
VGAAGEVARALLAAVEGRDASAVLAAVETLERSVPELASR